MRTILAAAIALLAAWPAVAATCTQSMLGTVAKPIRWSLYAVAGDSQNIACIITIRGAADVTGTCTSEKSSTKRTVSKSASRMSVTSACALSGTIVAGSDIAGTLVGQVETTGLPAPRAWGTMKRTKPTSVPKMAFTLFRI